jgi:UDP-N-acetylmuramate--alanine ligase
VGRRFQILGERHFSQGTSLIVDDYGHHPREIRATIDAFRSVWPDKRLVHVFQPHRYSRTQSLFSDFVDVLSLADELLLLDIYPAGESMIPGVTSESLVKEINRHSQKATLVTEQNIEQHLERLIKDGDVILMQGAGNIGQLAINLMQPIRETA